jgi:Zn-dependent protease with chaperone function
MPQTAQSVLYFPHLADGGPAAGQWQTRFTFINPNASSAAVTLSLYADSGTSLALNFGSGMVTTVTFNVAANGTYVLTSKMASSTVQTGWAKALASLPLQANVAFRSYQNGKASLEITAEPTLPSMGYRAVAAPLVGVAIANPFNSPLPATIAVYDGSGNSLGQKNLTIPAEGHTAFNLNQVFTSLPASFTGSLLITSQNAGWDLIAWAVYADSSGIISSLPDGRAAFPVSPSEQIITAFTRLLNAYQTSLPDFGAAPQLTIGTGTDDNAINAFASGGNTVTFNLALGELLGDSPSEIAFVVGHELGHIYQQRTGKEIFYTDVEWDADAWGLWMSLAAGYDPYAAAGTLGKLGMATGTANLGVQQWEDSQLAADAHGSFSTRIDNLTNMIESVCTSSTDNQNACNQYKTAVHPYLPSLSSVPLFRPSSSPAQ